ncbi:conserved hypothetical protein [Beggiatoa sp. PS]|nr:conserved hypothetical protein [Beggiatoa sp. PS]
MDNNIILSDQVMNPTVYVETSVISYLTAKSSRDIIASAKQQITQTWWNDIRHQFDIYISRLVLEEATQGNQEAADRRLEIIHRLPQVDITDNAIALAKLIMQNNCLPKKAENDALHIAIATIQKMGYLLTWNCKHIANATIQKEISKVVLAKGYELPILCTPDTLMRRNDDD